MLFGFSIRLNGFPRLFPETQRFLEDSETLRGFRDMFGNHGRFLGNSFTVSGAWKLKKVFDKKILKTQRYSRIRLRFPKRFSNQKRFPRKPLGFRKEPRVSQNTVEGFRIRSPRNPCVPEDPEIQKVFSETQHGSGNLSGYVYRFAKGFWFPRKRFFF